jgi:FAD/FMN-containing dehydrogenase
VRYFRDVLKDPSAIIGGNNLHGGSGSGSDASDAAELDAFNCDWMRKYRGQSRLVLRPKSTDEVQRILHFCNARRLAVVPQGGNSGLVGGSVPVFDEIVVSLARMDRIHSFDAVSGALVADAGCVLERVDGYLAERGHIFPLDLGAKGSCQLGGNVATNAGGLRLLRYGSLHGSVLGLEAVLPDGTLFDDLGTLRKNNTGFDVKQLFIGGEGSIGIITKVAVLCPPRPRAVNVALLGLDSFAQVQRAYAEAKGQLAEILSAFELMDGASQDIVQHVTQRKRPLDGRHPFYCLVETSGSRKEHDDEVCLYIFPTLALLRRLPPPPQKIFFSKILQNKSWRKNKNTQAKREGRSRNSKSSSSTSWSRKLSPTACWRRTRRRRWRCGRGASASPSASATGAACTSTTCPSRCPSCTSSSKTHASASLPPAS